MVLVVALAATIFRLLLLPREALDGDEVFTRSIGVEPFREAWGELKDDLVHPPLYYLALRPVVALAGDSPLALRALSLAAGLGILLLAGWWTKRRSGGWQWGLLVVVLLAVSPLQLLYSLTARGYALYAFLILGAAMLLARALRRPEDARGWVAFSLVAGAGMLTHYVASIYVLCMLPAILFSREARLAAGRWLLALAVPALALAAWLASVWPSYRAKGGLELNLAWVGAPGPYHLLALYGRYTGIPDFANGTTVALLLSAVVTGAGLLALRATRTGGAGSFSLPAGAGGVTTSDWVLLGAAALFPPTILFVLSQPPLSLPLWGERHALPSQAFWVVGMALLLRGVALRHRLPAWALATGLVAFQGLGLLPSLAGPLRVPYDQVADFLAAEARPGEAVLAASPHNVGRPVTYYLPAGMRVDSFASVGRSPSVLWLLFRPRATAERLQFDSLVAGGWEVRRTEHFGGSWGTTAARLERR